MRPRSYCLACLLLLCVAARAFADWPAQGKPVLYVLQSTRGIISAQILDTPSGDLMVVGQGHGGNGVGWNAVRITRDGDLAPGWTLPGACLGGSSFGFLGADHGLAVGGTGGLWHSWSEGANGLVIVPDTGPPDNCSPTQYIPTRNGTGAAGIPGSSDGYIVTGLSTVKRLTSAGATAAGWPAAGVVAVQGRDAYLWLEACLMPDGAGGVVVFMRTIDGPVASRVDGNAVRHAGWPVNGLLLGPQTSASFIPPPIWRLVPSGPDHCLALWVDDVNGTGTIFRAKMQRFGLDGALDPAWPAGGLEVVVPGVNEDVTLIADGEGGAHVLWESNGLPRGTHIHPAGSFYPGLDAQGRSLLPDGAQYVPLKQAGPPWLYSSSNVPYLVADRGLDAGLVFVWSEPSDPTQTPTRAMRVRWLRADLTPEPSEPDAGLLVLDDSGNSYAAVQRAAHADGVGGIFLAWESFQGDPVAGFDWPLAMTRVARPSVANVPPPAPSALALSIASPNPVRSGVALRVFLMNGPPAKLELFDVAGRRHRSIEVSGAGEHVQRFDDLTDLGAGVCFARVTQGGQTRTVHFVRLR